MPRKITPKQQEAFIKKCKDYLKSIAAIPGKDFLIYEWCIISVYGRLGITIDVSDYMYTIFMKVEFPQFVPKEEWLITKTNGKANIHITNSKDASEEAFARFKEFIERVKSPVHNENFKLTNT